MRFQSDTLRTIAPTPAEIDTAEQVRGLFGPIWHWVGAVIEAVGIVVLVLGLAVATVRYLRRRGPDAYHVYRSDLGRSILLGLEFLVAADLIGTVVVEPTFQNLGVLGLIVLIRTFLSFALETEISGHWPWKDSAYRFRARRAAGAPPEAEEV